MSLEDVACDSLFNLYYKEWHFFCESFFSETIKKPVFDPRGDYRQVKDVIVVKGDPLPNISTVIVQWKGQAYKIFNRIEWATTIIMIVLTLMPVVLMVF